MRYEPKWAPNGPMGSMSPWNHGPYGPMGSWTYEFAVPLRYTFGGFRGNGKKMVLDPPRWHGQKIVNKMVFEWSQNGRATIWDLLNTIFLLVFRKWRSQSGGGGRRPPPPLWEGGRRPPSPFPKNSKENGVSMVPDLAGTIF